MHEQSRSSKPCQVQSSSAVPHGVEVPELKLAPGGPGKAVKRLSDIHGDKWSGLKNRFGDPADVDFALSSTFQLFTKASATAFKAVCEEYYSSEYEYSTARTSACIRGAPKLTAAVRAIAPALESTVSSLAGVPLRVLDFDWEIAHVNVQRTPQSRPVDNWHQDSTPYVLVTVLTDHREDPGGSLLVNTSPKVFTFPKEVEEEKEVCRCKLTIPGEAVFMQGSHIWHCAQASAIGERLTLVTSFYAPSPASFFSHSIREALLYSPPAPCILQYLKLQLCRFLGSVSLLQTENNWTNGNSCALDVLTAELYKLEPAVQEFTNLLLAHKNESEETKHLQLKNPFGSDVGKVLTTAKKIASALQELARKRASQIQEKQWLVQVAATCARLQKDYPALAMSAQ